MNEADEERDRELQLEVGCWIAGTRLYLVHACRCCLVTERKQIERRELESTSPFIFLALFLFLLLALAFSKVPTQARARKQRHTLSLCVCLPPSHTYINTHSQWKPCPLLAVRMAGVLLSGRRWGKEGKEKQKERDAFDRKREERNCSEVVAIAFVALLQFPISSFALWNHRQGFYVSDLLLISLDRLYNETCRSSIHHMSHPASNHDPL